VAQTPNRSVRVDGFEIVAGPRVHPAALAEAAFWVKRMLSARPDARRAMIASGTRLRILGVDEFTCDAPEFAWLGKGPDIDGVSAKDWWDARARGTGGSATDPWCSVGEENVLGYPGDPYAKESILLHEFAHSIHLRGMNVVDPGFDTRVAEAFRAARADGLWRGTYASSNPAEYFAEGAQSWFDDNREDDHDHNHVNTRKELLAYDPRLAALCREVFGERVPSYSKPATRLKGHLRGYDPASAPRFAWPERLRTAKERIGSRAQGRARGAWAVALDTDAKPMATAKGEYVSLRMEGWTVHLRDHFVGAGRTAVDDFLPRLAGRLRAVCGALPARAVARLREVPIWVSPGIPGVESAARYHPDAGWLEGHGRDPAMAKGVEFTNVDDFAAQAEARPGLVLHELARAWHDQVVGAGDPRLAGLESASSDSAEVFAAASEVFFLGEGAATRAPGALPRRDPRRERLLRSLWGVDR